MSNILFLGVPCIAGFFMGRAIVNGEFSVHILMALVPLILVLFFMMRMDFGTKKALVIVGLVLSSMTLTIGVTRVVRELRSAYHTDPVFHAKVNAHVFRDPRWQVQLDSQWFEKKRVLIARHTLDIQRMRSVCGDPVQYRQIARNYNLAVDEYNKVVAGSMVGLQYAEPVRQLLIPQFNDQLAPCGSVFKPL